MPNSHFLSQIAWNKAENLQFGIKNANLATPSLVQRYGAGAQQFPTKNFQQKTIFYVCVCLSVLFANYNITNEWPTSWANYFSTQTFVVEL